MTFEGLKNNYISVVKDKFFCFEGRADRAEYWQFVLCNFIIACILSCIDQLIGTAVLSGLYSLAVLLPNLGVSVRRLHDINKSGLWLLIGLIPVIGTIILIVWACQKGTEGANDYDKPAAE